MQLCKQVKQLQWVVYARSKSGIGQSMLEQKQFGVSVKKFNRFILIVVIWFDFFFTVFYYV